MPALFRAQAARSPHRTAVASADARLTYGELDAATNRLAHRLIAAGAGPGQLVAVRLPRSVDLVVALLAVVKTGAGYVPLDVDYPAARSELIRRDADPRVTIDEPAAPAGPGPEPMTDPGRDVRPGDVAYVIYTSGSTGRPKGVVVEHVHLAAYLAFAVDAYPGLRGRSLLHSSIAFDLTVTALWGPLICGGCVCVAGLGEGDEARRALGGEPLTFLKVTPSHLPVLSALHPWLAPAGELVVGGEQLHGAAADEWRRPHPETTIVNEYGPTEATVGCCVFTVRPDEPMPAGPVPIGRPTPASRLYVLDAERRPVPDGGMGELFIGGSQVARGYHGNAAMTSERFLRDPSGGPGGRMYRTGDLVRVRPGGDLEFLGRTDDQVKIRGHRVELGEVEAALTTLPQVGQAAAALRAGTLVAWLSPAPGRSPAVDEVRRFAEATLPAYLRPGAYVMVPTMPLTPHGKVDKAALPDPAGGSAPAPADELERQLCDLLSEVLGRAVAQDDDFFAYGGDSVRAALVVARAREHHLNVRLRDLFEHRTAARLAAAHRSESDAGSEPHLTQRADLDR